MLDSLIPGRAALAAVRTARHRPSLAPGGSTHTHAHILAPLCRPPPPAGSSLPLARPAGRQGPMAGPAGPAGHRRADSLIQGPGKAWARPGQSLGKAQCALPAASLARRNALLRRRGGILPTSAHPGLCENNKDVSRREGALTWLVFFRARPGCRVPLIWNAPRGHRKRLASGQCSAWCSGRSRRAHGSARQR